MPGYIISFNSPIPIVFWEQVRIVVANDSLFTGNYSTLTGYGNMGYGVSYGG